MSGSDGAKFRALEERVARLEALLLNDEAIRDAEIRAEVDALTPAGKPARPKTERRPG